MIYICNKIEAVSYESAQRLVSSDRQIKAMKYRCDIDKRQSVLVFVLLRYALYKEYGLTEIPEFIYTETGKPLLKNHPHIHFNLSHCRSGVACALGNAPAGIDIEQIMPLDLELAGAVLSDEELIDVKTSAKPDETFCVYWTRKESLLKFTGEGISNSLRTIKTTGVNFLTRINATEGHVISVYSNWGKSDKLVFEIDSLELVDCCYNCNLQNVGNQITVP